MANMFLGSIAQEDVIFNTEVVTTYVSGQNYMDLLIYIEGSRYLQGNASAKYAAVYDQSIRLVTTLQNIVSYATVLNTNIENAIATMTAASVVSIGSARVPLFNSLNSLAGIQAVLEPLIVSLADKGVLDAWDIYVANAAQLQSSKGALDSAISGLTGQLGHVQPTAEYTMTAEQEFGDVERLYEEVFDAVSQFNSQIINDKTIITAYNTNLGTAVTNTTSSLSSALSETTASDSYYQAIVAAEGAWSAATPFFVTYMSDVSAYVASPTPANYNTVVADYQKITDEGASHTNHLEVTEEALRAADVALEAYYHNSRQAYNDAMLDFAGYLSPANTTGFDVLAATISGRDSSGGFIPFEENPNYSYSKLTVNNYATATKGELNNWLSDYYKTGHSGTVWLVNVGPDIDVTDPLAVDDFINRLKTVYAFSKVYAYWKTSLVGSPNLPRVAVELAKLCDQDTNLLSAAPMYPISQPNPVNLNSDPISEAIFGEGVNAWLVHHMDKTRNGALLALGDAMFFLNTSGTPVGNAVDYHGYNYISASGESGFNLPYATREYLKDKRVGFFKSVDSISGNVALIGEQTVKGDYISAKWIINYVNYMAKESVARYITGRNVKRNARTYSDILDLLTGQILRFVGAGTLDGFRITAPSFSNLPQSKGDEIIVPGAYVVNYVRGVHRVQVQGTLYIAG